MSLKDIGEAYKLGNVRFGLKSVLKSSKSKKKKDFKVFVAKNARLSTLETLQNNSINFEFTKTKEEVSKELDIGFESEVYLIE